MAKKCSIFLTKYLDNTIQKIYNFQGKNKFMIGENNARNIRRIK